MNVIEMILFMVVIGAIIGGATNYLAIKMLFRPYHEIRIGRWKLPFTPGLIPKRHKELSEQLGKTVVNYLITAEGIEKKLKNSEFEQGLTTWAQDEARQLLRSEKSVTEWLKDSLAVEGFDKQVVEKTNDWLSTSYDRFFQEKGDLRVVEVLPLPIQDKIQGGIPVVTDVILERADSFFSSSEGKEQLSQMVDRFFMTRGTLGNMISMFLGNERLVDKVQPELLKFVRDQETRDFLQKVLEQEWEKLKEKQVADFQGLIQKKSFVQISSDALQKHVPFFRWTKSPLVSWTGPYEDVVINSWIPKLIRLTTELFIQQLDHLLVRIHLDDIVREQVEAFSLERLEELVLSIAKKELKMITYLGAILGGAVGLIQGFVVIIMG
ncbi:DUF445 domain-containing protein [Halalkalibacterium ligniniphilum]|uniref:DUF445 domain-containing protein n=1 Tax=Halalkalibacterium ligniniphilum TaxID=1134413 RepID=UPI0003471DA6|nr:DUF445 family protein [Halalkalibacterium ligniniphilum]